MDFPMKPKLRSTAAPAKSSASSRVVQEEITKATQTAQLLGSDLGSAYKAAEDPLLQIVLLRLMRLANELRSELTRFTLRWRKDADMQQADLLILTYNT
jgi:hypothetical protein